MMKVLMIGGKDFTDYVSSLRINYETLVSEDSGRNANGDAVIDIVNNKIKLIVGFRPLDGTEMANLLSAISSYVVSVGFLDSRSNSMTTIQCYTGTPSPNYYWVNGNQILYKSFSLNFIEL